MKVIFLSLLFLSLFVSRLVGSSEFNSTLHFAVGELAETWQFPSDHLPVGATVNGIPIASWNVLDTAALHWIESNAQGLSKSAIMSENVKENDTLTKREERICEYILSMVDVHKQARALIALQEVSPTFLSEIKHRLPENILAIALENGTHHGDVFLYDSNIFDFISIEADTYSCSSNTWMKLVLKEIKTGFTYEFIHSHTPGGEASAICLQELADLVLKNFNPNAITIIMGDQNRSPDYFIENLVSAAKTLKWRAQPFAEIKINYPTHVNTQMEASWIDNLFVAAFDKFPLDVVASPPESFFPEVKSAVDLLWSYFPLQKKIEKTKEVLKEKTEGNTLVEAIFDDLATAWRRYYLEKEGNFDLRLLLRAVRFAACRHEGQYRDGARHLPSMAHCLQVAQGLWVDGEVRSSNVLAAAVLNDTLEDTTATFVDLMITFGPRIADTVQEITNDPSLGAAENKKRQIAQAPTLSLDAQNVKLADRLANLRDLRSHQSQGWCMMEADQYFQWGKNLLEAMSGANCKLERQLSSLIKEK
jgi:guanosine-3',5'-bis(diphosphate) 3'-pyrophosphohydrolase